MYKCNDVVTFEMYFFKNKILFSQSIGILFNVLNAIAPIYIKVIKQIGVVLYIIMFVLKNNLNNSVYYLYLNLGNILRFKMSSLWYNYKIKHKCFLIVSYPLPHFKSISFPFYINILNKTIP